MRSAKRQLEEKLLRQATHRGPQTLRDFVTYQKTHSRDEIETAVAMLVKARELFEHRTPQTVKYDCATGSEKGAIDAVVQ